MKSIRLLPVVIFAALALLLFKGIGLMTSGGYVLVGTEVAQAEGAAPAEPAPAEGGGPTLELPKEVTLTDTSPTLGDADPTIGLRADGEPGAESSASSEVSGDVAAVDGAAIPNIDCPALDAPVASAEATDGASSEAAADPHAASSEAAPATDCPTAEIPVNEFGDAVPTTKLADGSIVPLATVDGENNETAVLERLSSRRAELDKLAADLEMRAALVEAAEKRLDERSAQLKDLEAQIAALVDQKQAEEDAQFKAVVSMYETMKPKDAAKIFDQSDLNVMLRVARAMNPRKMAPVLAAMDPAKAQALTAAMATDLPPPVVGGAGEDLANLPQIVGK